MAGEEVGPDTIRGVTWPAKKHYKKMVARLERSLKKTEKLLRKVSSMRGGKSNKPIVVRAWKNR